MEIFTIFVQLGNSIRAGRKNSHGRVGAVLILASVFTSVHTRQSFSLDLIMRYGKIIQQYVEIKLTLYIKSRYVSAINDEMIRLLSTGFNQHGLIFDVGST